MLREDRRGGWSLVRASAGSAEGWFPSSFLRAQRRAVAVVDLDTARIREARRRLGSSSPPRGARPLPDGVDTAKSPAAAAALQPPGSSGRGATPGGSRGRSAGGGESERGETCGLAADATPGKARLPPGTPASGRKPAASGAPSSLPPPPSMPPPSADKRCRRPTERLSPRWEKGEEPAPPAMRDEGDLAVAAGRPAAEPARAGGPGRKRAYGGAGKGGDEEEVAACAIPCTVGLPAARRPRVDGEGRAG